MPNYLNTVSISSYLNRFPWAPGHQQHPWVQPTRFVKYDLEKRRFIIAFQVARRALPARV